MFAIAYLAEEEERSLDKWLDLEFGDFFGPGSADLSPANHLEE